MHPHIAFTLILASLTNIIASLPDWVYMAYVLMIVGVVVVTVLICARWRERPDFDDYP